MIVTERVSVTDATITMLLLNLPWGPRTVGPGRRRSAERAWTLRVQVLSPLAVSASESP